MKKKRTIEKIKEIAAQRGYECLSTEYNGVHSKIQLRCSKGHLFGPRVDSFLNGSSCPYCSRKKVAERSKRSNKKIEIYINYNGFQWISGKYKNSYSKLKFKCSKGHIFEKRWDCFYRTPKCPVCSFINFSITYVGPKSSGWKGGISFEPYCKIWSNSEFKELIKERDGHKCMNPYCFRKGTSLVVHHINYDKKDCSLQNLITVCNSCNSYANKDRDWHKDWYQLIIQKRRDINNDNTKEMSIL